MEKMDGNPGTHLDVDSMMPFFDTINMTITAIVVVIPLSIWTLKQVCSLYKNVPSASLKTPAILIFMAPLVLQLCNLISIQVKDSEQALVMVALFAKLYIMVLFYSFYFMIREVVFYEHLLQQAEAINADPAFSDSAASSSSQVSGGIFSLAPRELQPSHRRRPHDLKEQLMAVNYDRAILEEKILNQVYPSYELQHNTTHNEDHFDGNKQNVLNTEIFEIGKVARCFTCASVETFDSIENADQFRKNTVCSFAFFGIMTFVKTMTEFLLREFYMQDNISETAVPRDMMAVLIFPALDVFEMLLTFYTLYCTLLLCSCLAQGLIFEYQPVTKFIIISMMTLMAVCQDFVIYVLLGMFPAVDEEQKFIVTQQAELAMRVNSFLVSIEAVILIVYVTKHFRISSGNEDVEDDGPQYEQNSFDAELSDIELQPDNSNTNKKHDNCIKH